MSTSGSLYTQVMNGVAYVEFGHPAANSFPADLLERLASALDQLSEEPEVRVILLKSEGDKTFCAGASFDELKAVADEEDGKIFFGGFARVINAMRKCKKPIVVRVQGKAVGGGVGIIAASDYALATEGASIRLSELSLGIGPFVIAPAIERKMGVGALAELTLNPKTWQTAYWAKEKGLFAGVFSNVKELDHELDHLLAQLASVNPEALEALKRTLWESYDHWETLLTEKAAISGRLVLSDFTREMLSRK